jgi:LytS/YehU family sensor histidine kinase
VGIPLVALTMSLIFGELATLKGMELLWEIVFSLLITVIIWKGNSFIVRMVKRYYSWETHPAFRISAQSLLTIFFSISSFLVLSNIFSPILHVPNITEGNPEIALLSIAAVTMIINAIYEGLYFSRRWRFSVMRAEVLKRSVLRAQYESLKNQINPHFLFNSLNTLSHLIDENPGNAVNFVHNLATAYRYLLQNKDYKLVKARQELKFTETYLELLQTRYGCMLKADFEVDENMTEKKLPPLSLQILVENAVKYNSMSKDQPLHISIELNKSLLTVRNNLQPNEVVEEYTKLGLGNIRDRYQELTQMPVEIITTETEFIVKLPLIG